MKKIAEITLGENSAAGNQPKIFPAQTVEIEEEPPTVVQGVGRKFFGSVGPPRYWQILPM
jgi:hypothetical protein